MIERFEADADVLRIHFFKSLAGADEEADLEKVPVPALTGLAIGLCTGVTVLFGVWPQPLIDFANHATLLFLPK